MSCPFSAQELRDLITKLERLETWQKQAEASAGSSSRGYTRGDPKARAKAAGPVLSKPVFPAIPQIAFRFTLVKEAGPEFIGAPFPGVEEGPGPLPALLRPSHLPRLRRARSSPEGSPEFCGRFLGKSIFGNSLPHLHPACCVYTIEAYYCFEGLRVRWICQVCCS